MPDSSVRETWEAYDAAEYYERSCVPKKFEPWPPVLHDRVGLHGGERVLDCACGTGVATRAAARRVGPAGRVVGLDLNESMLAVARTVPHDHPIEWVLAPVEHIPFGEAAFDVVTCELGLMFFADRVLALREMRRVLAVGGRIGVLVWRSLEHAPAFKLLADVVERHLEIDADPIRWPYNLGNAETLHELAAAAGFRNVATHAEVGPLRYTSAEDLFHGYLSGSPIAAAFRNTSPDAHRRAIADLEEQLAPFVRDGQMQLTIGAYVVVAYK